MPIGGDQPEDLEAYVAALSSDDRKHVRRNNEAQLKVLQKKSRSKKLSKEDAKSLERAVETIAAIDTLEAGKGEWFRLKRSFQLLWKFR